MFVLEMMVSRRVTSALTHSSLRLHFPGLHVSFRRPSAWARPSTHCRRAVIPGTYKIWRSYLAHLERLWACAGDQDKYPLPLYVGKIFSSTYRKQSIPGN